jgi:hypothetical protein
MDSVLLTLGDTQAAENDFDEAWLSYVKVINEFPASQLVTTAYQRLQTLEEKRQRSYLLISFENQFR